VVQQLIEENTQENKTLIQILHVDNEKSFLMLTRKHLIKFIDNLAITSLSSLSKVPEAIESTEYDIIISNRLEPIQEVRNGDISLPFVIFSDDHTTEFAINAINLGADYFLHKGDKTEVVFKELSTVILKLIDQSRISFSKDAQAKSNQLLIDSFPNIMALISFKTREIVASNKAAQLIGAEVGTRCFETFFERKGQCPWCKAPEASRKSTDQYIEVVKMGRQWACFWYYVSEKYYMHYIEDITRKRILIEEWKEQIQKTVRAN
jgi:DNA-binding NarL/FixJ family response regulator